MCHLNVSPAKPSEVCLLTFADCIWSQMLGDSLYFDFFVRQLSALLVALLHGVHARIAL